MIRKLHYGWIILILAFVTLLSVQGIRLSFGAFMHPWEHEFTADRGVVSLIALVSYVVYGASQPLIGRIIDRFGVRTVLAMSTLIVGISTILTHFVTASWQLMLLYGVISSIGFGGASNVAASVAVANWFQEKRGFALGFVAAGSGAGQLLIVPAALFLIDWFGWKVTVLILGMFVTVVVFPLVLLFLRSHPSEKGLLAYGASSVDQVAEKKSNGAQKIPLAMLRTRKFWFLILPYFVCGVTTTGLMDTHLIPFAHDHGYSTQTTGAAVSLLAAFNILGTLLSGYLADRWSNKNTLAFLYAMRSGTILLLLMTSQPMLLLAFAILFGLCDFATVAPTLMLATTYFKEYSVGMMIGWLYLSHQLGSAAGAYLPGIAYQLTGTYNLSFVAAVVLLLVVSVFSFLLPETKKTGSSLT